MVIQRTPFCVIFAHIVPISTLKGGTFTTKSPAKLQLFFDICKKKDDFFCAKVIFVVLRAKNRCKEGRFFAARRYGARSEPVSWAWCEIRRRNGEIFDAISVAPGGACPSENKRRNVL